MAYVKQTWDSDDLISADKLKHMEDGIYDASSQVPTSILDAGDSSKELTISYNNTPGDTKPTNWIPMHDNTTGNLVPVASAYVLLLTTSAFPIPSSGHSVTKTINKMTANHQLIKWNFSSSPENNPPVKLNWTTGDNFFTITNNGGTTSETIQPIFALPTVK